MIQTFMKTCSLIEVEKPPFVYQCHSPAQLTHEKHTILVKYGPSGWLAYPNCILMQCVSPSTLVLSIECLRKEVLRISFVSQITVQAEMQCLTLLALPNLVSAAQPWFVFLPSMQCKDSFMVNEKPVFIHARIINFWFLGILGKE